MTQPWFASYLKALNETLGEKGLKLDPSDSTPDGRLTSFVAKNVSAKAIKAFFKREGFTNSDGRTYMAHTGNPHINLEDREGNIVQISWHVHGFGPVGVSFLSSIKEEA